MVAPRADLAAQPSSLDVTHRDGAPFVLPFVMLAVVLLAWDALTLARRLLRDYGPRARASA
jgi:hypothetical protein